MASPENTATVGPIAVDLDRAETALVVLIALHSFVVGVFLVFVPEWGARFGGFGAVSPLFFARQAGAFHFVAATAYLVEYFRYRGVLLLVVTKSVAVVFLLMTSVVDTVPWVVPLSGVADGFMGLAVVLLRRARGCGLAGPSGRGRA